jgi:hypothetical protein
MSPKYKTGLLTVPTDLHCDGRGKSLCLSRINIRTHVSLEVDKAVTEHYVTLRCPVDYVTLRCPVGYVTLRCPVD